MALVLIPDLAPPAFRWGRYIDIGKITDLQ